MAYRPEFSRTAIQALSNFEKSQLLVISLEYSYIIVGLIFTNSIPYPKK